MLEPNTFGFIALAGLILIMMYHHKDRVRLCLLVAIGVTAIRCSYEIVMTHGYHPDFLEDFFPSAHLMKSWTAMFWLLAPLGLVSLEEKAIHKIGLGIFLMASSITLGFKIFGTPEILANKFGEDTAVGMIYNPSMNPALIAVTMPFVRVTRNGWLSLAAMIWTCYIIASSHHLTPALVYGSFFCARAIRMCGWKIIPIVLLFPAACVFHFYHFHAAARFSDYRFFWTELIQHWNIWYGMGVNKFAIYGPMLQYSVHHRTADLWYFLHSDWAEILFQQGIIGCVLWGWVSVKALYHSMKEDWILFEASIGMAAFMIGYFPLHVSSSAIVACLCLTSLRKKNEIGKPATTSW